MRGISRKRGVSPVIATILLIAIVIILAVIIFLWARGFVSERAQKFGRAVELSCQDVNFEPGIFLSQVEDPPVHYLDIINRGDIPLYGFEVKELGTGTLIVKKVLTETVTVGNSVSISLGEQLTSGTNLIIVPIILGESDSGKVAHTCPDQLGFAVGVV